MFYLHKPQIVYSIQHNRLNKYYCFSNLSTLFCCQTRTYHILLAHKNTVKLVKNSWGPEILCQLLLFNNLSIKINLSTISKRQTTSYLRCIKLYY